MKKQYTEPSLEVIRVANASFLALSGEIEGEIWGEDKFNDGFGSSFDRF